MLLVADRLGGDRDADATLAPSGVLRQGGAARREVGASSTIVGGANLARSRVSRAARREIIHSRRRSVGRVQIRVEPQGGNRSAAVGNVEVRLKAGQQLGSFARGGWPNQHTQQPGQHSGGGHQRRRQEAGTQKWGWGRGGGAPPQLRVARTSHTARIPGLNCAAGRTVACAPTRWT